MTDETKTGVVATYDPAAALMNPASFEHLQRVGAMLAHSALFPEHLRKGNLEQAKANGALVMNMAVRLREDPLTVAQSIYFVGGKPGWSTQYAIAKANQHGVFSEQIDWDVTGEGDNLSVTAFATLARSGRRVSMTCDMAMAKAEGWVKNPKYKTMPEVMLRYRSAAFLIRMYCPEVMVGIPTTIEIELESMRDVTPPEASAAKPKAAPKAAAPEPEVDEAEEVIETEHKDAAAPVDDDLAQDAKHLNGKAEPEKTEDTTSPAKDPAPGPDMEQFMHLTDSILRDIEDVAPDSVDDVLDLYDAQLDQIKTVAPDLHSKIMGAAHDKKGDR